MVEAQATPTNSAGGAPRTAEISGWRWALATLAVVAVILAATFATHSIVARERRPPATPGPVLPPLHVLAVTAPDIDYELTALDSSLGRVVALAADHQPQCPAVGSCPAAPALTSFVILDGTTGQVFTTTPLKGEAAEYAGGATALTVDKESHRAYAVGPGHFAIFSVVAGAFISGGPLPALSSGASWVGAAFDDAHQQLFALGSDGTLASYQRNLFPPLPAQPISEPAGQYSGMALDSHGNVVYTLRRGSAGQGAMLLAIDTTTLAIVAQVSLPSDATLGPIDATTGAVSLLGADGSTYYATLANGQLTLATAGFSNAVALGWNAALGHTYVAHDDNMQVLDVSGKAVAALPVRVYGGATLLTDPARNLLYLPANGGSLLIVQDAATPPSTVPNANTAILLARAALTNYLPDTNQNPPYLDSETFWPGASTPQAGGGASATRVYDFWIHFSDRGWTGPYSGSTETAYMPLSGQPNSYQVTFTITWQQIFQRSHTWTLNVAPDGSVAYVSDGGDVVP